MADMRTPLGKVRGLGSVRDGTTTFWRQRLTAVANLPLVLFFVGLIVALNGAGHAETRSALANPFVALPLMFLLASALFHMRIGMKEIIEDYIHGEALKIVLVMLNTFFAIGVGLACFYSLLKIAFGG